MIPSRDPVVPSRLPRGLAVLVLLASALPAVAEPVALGERHSFRSETVGHERSYTVVLPPSYGASEARYPVLYFVDGDYNLLPAAGLLEQMSSVAGQIPEAILVAIGDRGSETYRRFMKPDLGEDPGRAEAFMEHLTGELVPRIDAAYRTSPLRILAGHSLGGLFTIATALDRPDAFSAYVAISPSLWWGDLALNRRAETVFAEEPELSTRLWFTLGNERGMGVHDFVETLETTAPAGLDWHYRHWPEESHGSVGLPSLRWALAGIFEGFELGPDDVDVDALVVRYRALGERLGFEPRWPSLHMKYLVGSLVRRDLGEELARLEEAFAEHFPGSRDLFLLARGESRLGADDAEGALADFEAALAANPASFDALSGQGRVLRALGRVDEARTAFERALARAEEAPARRWQWNQLRSELEPPAVGGARDEAGAEE